MAYQKQIWENLPSTNTPISADRLNHMEDGIADAWEHGGGGETLPVGSEIDYDGETVPTGWEQISDKAKVLWTNPNPTSDFSAQSITLSSDDYDMYEIIYSSEASGEFSSIYNMTKSIKGYGTILQTVNPMGSTSPNRARVVKYVSDTKLSFSVGYTGVNYPLGTNNSKCIPLYVIGHKTGLF